jgi:hypothetical protein
MLVAVACVHCGAGEPAERVERTTQAVIGGASSGPEDNLSVALDNRDSSRATLHCSGTLVAPNLVLTARHCILQALNRELPCKANGELVDPSDPRGQNLPTQIAANVTATFGVNRASTLVARGVEILTPAEVSLCRGDVAFVVLDRALAPSFVALRMGPVAVGERFRVSGWGYTADDQSVVPPVRASRDDLRVEEIGPGLIPSGTFAIAGATLCFGDSGAAALIRGAVAGVYSRIEGGACSLATGRNLFMMPGPQRELVERAFRAAGRVPWYEGEPGPTVRADAGAASDGGASEPDACQGGASCAAPEVPSEGGAQCSLRANPNRRPLPAGLLIVLGGIVLASGWRLGRRARARKPTHGP